LNRSIVIRCSFLLLSILFSSSASTAEGGFEYILQDTLAQLIQRLHAEGAAGAFAMVEIPRETYQIELEEPETPDLPSAYLIHRTPLRVRVEDWRIESATFTAKRITLLNPSFQIYQGTPKSIEAHLRKMQTPDEPDSDHAEEESPGGGLAENHRPGKEFNALGLVQDSKTVFKIDQIQIDSGIITGIDTYGKPGASAQLRNVALDLRGLTIPDELRSHRLSWDLALEIASATPGSLSLDFTDHRKNENDNFNLGCKARELDLNYLSPFLVFDSEWKISGGTLGIELDATCEENQFESYNLLLLDKIDLSLEDQESWLGSLLLKTLAKAGQAVYDEVQLDFTISGDLSDPNFDLEDAYEEALENSLIRWTTLRTLRSLGLKNGKFLTEKARRKPRK